MNLPKNIQVMQQANNYVSQSTVKKLRVRPFSEDAIVFAKVGAAISHERKRIAFSPFLIDNNMMAFTPKQKEDLKFIYYLFQKIKLSKYSQVGALPSYNTSDILDIRTFYPTSGNECKMIVTILSLVDSRIEKQCEIIDQLKKYKRGVIQKFFSEKDMAQWKVVKLKDVVDIFDGTHQTPNYKSEGVRFISVENILNPLSTEKYISDDDYRKEFKIHPEYGDVLMTRIGDIGRTYYIDFNVDMAYYVSLALFKCSSKIDGRYLAAYISTNNFQKELWERTLHIAFPKKINTGEIGECFIRLPNTARQIAISDQLNLVEQKIRLAEKQHDLLQAMRKGLLQQLFI